MRIDELFGRTPESPEASYYDPNEDKLNRRDLGDTRKQPEKLTLRKLNRLKKIRAVREFERKKEEDLLQVMYGKNSGGDTGGGMF